MEDGQIIPNILMFGSMTLTTTNGLTLNYLTMYLDGSILVFVSLLSLISLNGNISSSEEASEISKKVVTEPHLKWTMILISLISLILKTWNGIKLNSMTKIIDQKLEKMLRCFMMLDSKDSWSLEDGQTTGLEIVILLELTWSLDPLILSTTLNLLWDL